MTMLRVLVVMGTRPEVIKMAPVIEACRARPDALQVRICATAQHREMLDQALALFGICPDLDLDLMAPGQTPAELGAKVLAAFEPVLRKELPDWVLVQGDTTTVVAAALCSHYNRVSVGHVEAGLRSYDRANPFPEEMNRVVADHISDLNFAPTPRARENLRKEGIEETRIVVTGNTVIDALLQVAGRPWCPPENDPLCQLGRERKWILVTAHRRENLGAPLRRICAALKALAAREDVQIIYPVHLNPEVTSTVRAMLGDTPRILLLPPVDYQRLVFLMRNATLILTDSGGIQEEAPSLGVPVLVLRETTERPEATECGAARVVGTDTLRILTEAEHLLDNASAHAAMARRVSPFGDGRAAERIVEALLKH
jgi:UDP-N-acetylglucosamine 2-epimerase (non-hydrolysing)